MLDQHHKAHRPLATHAQLILLPSSRAQWASKAARDEPPCHAAFLGLIYLCIFLRLILSLIYVFICVSTSATRDQNRASKSQELEL